ncbi:MAG: hypothetical protein II916_06200, partial [Oscillospiraceae bacterium]|nr:hypothetical protein [Oscillospiraceae bacterium]
MIDEVLGFHGFRIVHNHFLLCTKKAPGTGRSEAYDRKGNGQDTPNAALVQRAKDRRILWIGSLRFHRISDLASGSYLEKNWYSRRQKIFRLEYSNYNTSRALCQVGNPDCHGNQFLRESMQML